MKLKRKPIIREPLTRKEKFSRKIKEIKEDLHTKFMAILFFSIAGFFFWVLIQVLYQFYGFSMINWIQEIPYVYDVFKYFLDEISAGTRIGVFYMYAFSSLFFLPIPLEALFFKTLNSGIAFLDIFILVVGGIVVGQIVNYFLGRFFGFIFIHFIKRKTQKEIKHKLSKYGIFAVTSVHVIPFPFQIFNFITGVLKYPFIKWVLFVTLGCVIKHLIMFWMFAAVM